ncbi:hypothetical protein B1992_13850 [Pseudoxanthomonas broegbernensis]|uniref:Uncharacterized protein n=1 Tax=Pseudoxanthomonas broegbernensis TaxID=83619 RepID=A0A7V8K635_9GAMM|nr:hypothetical protein B1992_13850 [Pseudoxanthomonas broegbernensis]
MAGLSVIVGFNLSSERASLRDFKEEIRTEVRERLGSGAQPSLDLMTLERKPLAGATVDAAILRNAGNFPQISFRYAVANRGRGNSGALFARYYSTDIPFTDPNIDDTEYETSTFVDALNFSPSTLPGGVSMPYTANLRVAEGFVLGDGPASVRMRIYYADGETATAEFRLRGAR